MNSPEPVPSGGPPAPVEVRRITVARTARYAVCGASPALAERLWVVFHGYGMRAADMVATFAEVVPANTRIVAPEGLSRFYLRSPAPDGSHLTETGATWLTRDDREHELRDALAMLQSVVAREHAAIRAARPTGALRTGVLGFSQGVAMSMRWLVVAGENPSLRAERAVVAARGAARRADAGHVDAELADAGLADSVGPPVIHSHVLWAGGLAHDVPDSALRSAWARTRLHMVVGDRDRFATEATRASMRERLRAIGVVAEEHTFAGGHRLHSPLLATLLEAMPAAP